MNISHPPTGSLLLALLIIPILLTSCAVIGGRPKGVGLAGKTIVLDPGHGGEHLGAVGLDGLEEKTTNLWVGKRLKKMLEDDGAKVYMTRESDDQTVPLKDRVTFTKRKEADLFVSLHHNANAQVDRSIDRSELYYSWWSDGPSRDVANSLYASFHRHLGLPQLPVRPAIYYVTKYNDEPCILGEPSYIGNPEREAKLKSDSHQQEEAQAYHEGIKSYFEGGIPRIEEFQINQSVIETGVLTVRATLLDELGGLGIDPASIELMVDDRPVSHHFDHRTGKLTAQFPEPLASGAHKIFLMARNRRGNAAKPVQEEFTVALPPATLQLTCKPIWAPVKGTFAIRARAILTDKNGNPAADGTKVSFVTDRGKPGSSEDSTRGGCARTSILVKDPKSKALIFATSENLYDRLVIQFDSTCASLITGTVTSGHGEAPLAGVWVRLGDRLTRTDDLGGYLFEGVDPGAHELEAHCPGHLKYEGQVKVRKGAGLNHDITLQPLYDGLLLDKSVAIDAEFGGDQPGAVGPAGLKAADINLRVAQYLRDYLIAAGATVYMTRTQFSETIDPVARTRFVRNLAPHRLVSISHSNPYMDEDGSRCHHFYTDQEGRALAEHIQKHLIRSLGTPDLGIEEWSSYLMIEANVDRALVTPTVITDASAEQRLREPVHLRREAYAIFCGLLEDFGLNTETAGTIEGAVTGAEGNALEGALVVLDDALGLQTGPDGLFRFSCVPPGARTITVHLDGFKAHRSSLKLLEGKKIRADIQLSEKK